MASGRKLCKSVRLLQTLLALLLLTIISIILYKRRNSELADDVIYNSQKDYGAEKEEGGKQSQTEEEQEMLNRMFEGKRLVHLDLKGAPPKISYFSWFFPFIKKLGATGVLIEYEDMFPYTSIDASARNAYTKEEIDELLKVANESSLEVVPLIQTFGHLEFVLKLEKYTDLREVKKYPQAICPSKESSLEVLKGMIDDIMEAHKGYNIKYLHIGCDEVYQIGECNDCKLRILNNKWNVIDLFLDHVSTLAKYIRTVYPGVTPLIWDDQMRSIPLAHLVYWKIGDLVEPVVWKYTPNIKNDLPPPLWDKYSAIFPSVWFGSAFKGAKLPDTIVSPVNYYFDNHRSWKSVIAMYSDQIKFKGGILTGWQRFDHFAILCELLPVAIPSLAVNLIYMSSNIKTLSELSVQAHRITGCSVFAPMEFGGKQCSYPGSALYQEISHLSQIIYRIELAKSQSTFKGWMTGFNFDNSFSSPSHVEDGSREFLTLYMEIVELQANIETAMEAVYSNETIKEWISVYLTPYKNELKAIVEGRDKILALDHWPKRPIS